MSSFPLGNKKDSAGKLQYSWEVMQKKRPQNKWSVKENILKMPPHLKHICFLLSHKSNREKTKELNFSHRTGRKLKNYLYFWTESYKQI